MSVKPILFNTEMVRAILDGRKTVARRVIKPEPRIPKDDFDIDAGDVVFWKNKICRMKEPRNNNKFAGDLLAIPVKHYQPGDILYVRETWLKSDDKYYYRADFDSDYLDACETLSGGYPAYCRYHPDCDGCMAEPTRLLWRPSIHMPKEAARIWLEVTDVRVERLKDIVEKDAISEGITDDMAYSANGWKPTFYDPDSGGEPEYISAFSCLWDSTIKKKDIPLYGWDANPWVWVVEFERTVKPDGN